MKFDIVIVGGGVGGCAAALAACDAGCRVLLTEESDWLGGQLTSQAVPPDESFWIESTGATARYRRYRHEVRAFYRRYYPLNPQFAATDSLNPGGGYVSRLCHEPRVSVWVLEAMLMPHRASGRLTTWMEHEPIAADVEGDTVRCVRLRDRRTGAEREVEGAYFLDATELGDLLPLTGTEYVSGAESRTETGELHAPAEANPENVQAITWCFAMGLDPRPGADHRVAPPADYARWRNYTPTLSPPWCGPMFSWTRCHHQTLEPDEATLFAGSFSQFRFRQIVAADRYAPDSGRHDVTLVNWVQADYMEGNLIDKPEAERDRYLEEARQQSLAFFHWMQTESPNPATGSTGHPNLYLASDILGTIDGLAKRPYIRESRRIRARFTVTEAHVGTEMRTGHRWTCGRWEDGKGPDRSLLHAEAFHDSVGIGAYRIDLHPSTGGDNYIDLSCLPFQIPLGSLIPQRIKNLLPACKNLGVTHITNGCYRLHPVEWNIGEAAGALAAYCINHGHNPTQVHEEPALLAEFQSHLVGDHGLVLQWPNPHELHPL